MSAKAEGVREKVANRERKPDAVQQESKLQRNLK